MLQKLRQHLFIIVTVISIIALIPVMGKSERVGDRLQYALPIMGLACSFDLKAAGEYTARYALGLASVRLFKNALPGEGLNQRPNGDSHGFPSGHTYSATFGAAYLARACAEKLPYIGPMAILAAGYTASSRVEADKHTPFQVLWGAIFAILFDLGFRKTLKKRRIRKSGASQGVNES